MTIRTVALHSTKRTTNHADTGSNTIPAGSQAILIYDDSAVTTMNQMRALVQDIMQAAASCGYVKEK